MIKKRILSAILAVAMLLTFIPTFAVTSANLTVTAGTVTVEEGAPTVSVPVNVTNNPGICTMKVKVAYDTSVLTLTAINKGDLSSDMTNNKDTGVILLNASEDVTGDGLLATLVFSIVEGAASGTYPLTLSDGGTVNFDEVKGTATLVNGAVVIPESEPAGALTVTAGTVTVEEGAPTVSVPVNVTNNPGICTMKVKVAYDTSVLTLTAINKGDLSSDMTNNKDTGVILLNASEDVTGDGLLATLVFSIVEGAASGTYPLTLSDGGTVNFDEVKGTATLVNGSVTIPQGTVPDQEITGVTFDSATVEYDGAEKELTVSGTLPAGVTVAYTSNKGTNAGTYNATAVLSGEGYITKTLNATLEITKKNLTVDGLTAVSREYDGTNAATFTGGTLADKVTDDDVSFTAAGTFADVNVGENIEVTTTVTLTGADANNYTVTQPTGLTANITKRPITIKADDKPATQNGTMPDLTYTITSGSLVDQNDLTGELECSADLAVEDEYAITQGTLAVTNNYELTFIDGILTVTAKPTQNVTIADVATKTYGDADFTLDITDNNTALGAFTYSGNNDAVATVAADGTITIVGVGTVTITVERAETADFAAYSDTVTFTVAKKAITATATAENREYNGGVDATVAISLEGKVDGDEVSATATGTFADKNVGENKEVTLAGFTVSGADADNYEVATPSNPTANITAKALTVEGLTADDKAYDGTTVATVTGATLVGAIGSDDVELNAITGAFANKNVGTDKEVVLDTVTLTGNDAGNYTVAQPSNPTADITKLALTVTGLSTSNREYDGTAVAVIEGGTLEGVIGGDAVELGAITGAFDDKNVGTGKTVTVTVGALTGADAGNYTVTQPAPLTADITAMALTVTATAENKEYDGTDAADVDAELSGAVSGDDVELAPYTATFADKNVGTGKAVTLSALTLEGADAANYTVATPAPLTADITAKALTVEGLTADDKAYDGTTVATVTGATLVGAIGGDAVALTTVDGTFASANAGENIEVTITVGALTGADAANYTVATPAPLTANITKADVTVDAIDLDTGVATLTGVLPADTAVELDFDAISIAIEGTTATVTNLTLKGTNSENYNVTTTSVVDAAISAENFATVTLTATNGTATGAGTYLKGASVTVVATPASGYTFDGWYAGGTRVSTSASYTFTLNEDVALEARFARAAVAGGGGATAYTVKFETNGAKKIASQSVRRNGTAKEPTAPVKEGYTFAGWYTDAALTQKYDFSTTVKKSFTLYAGWTAVDDGTETELPKDQFILTIGKVEAGVWGEAKENDVAPVIVNDRTMLPARFVAENIGANVEWIPEERQVKITKGDIEIIIIIDSDVAYVNGEEVKLDSPAFIKNDRTYTPVRFIAEKLGAKVDWVEGSSQVVITK